MADRTYQILSDVHTVQWDTNMQQAIPGHQIKALWIATGHVLDVFVPDANYGPDQVDQLVRHAGSVDEQVAALGA